MATEDELRRRRYLLGSLSDDESAALEAEYFAQEATFDRVWATENELIDSYLSGALSTQDREQFEHHYLSVPQHRSRVASARELRRVAAEYDAARSIAATGWWWTSLIHELASRSTGFKAAAGVVVLLVVIAGAWIGRVRPSLATVSRSPKADSGTAQPPDRVSSPEAAPRSIVAVAVTLSPATVRGADDAASVMVQAGADLLVVHLDGDVGAPSLGADHAILRTVSGNEVWRGPAVPEQGARPTAVARIEIPANALSLDDYIITLLGTDAKGVETELHRYFVRVRR